MNVFAWNCQGIGSTLTFQTLKAHRNLSKSFLFLCETMSPRDKVESFMSRLGFSDCFPVNPTGLSGGLVFGWPRGASVSVIGSTSFFIAISVINNNSLC
ncbi:unnamed protein product, partial [Linum tenue]